jgi:hypothetical protein
MVGAEALGDAPERCSSPETVSNCWVFNEKIVGGLNVSPTSIAIKLLEREIPTLDVDLLQGPSPKRSKK